MFDHIGLRVTDLPASARFYEAALAPLGYAVCSRDDTSVGIGPPDAPALWLHHAPPGGGSGAHVALHAPDRAAVSRFHAAGLAAGGRDNGAPGLRADYAPTYYAAFLTDPDGNNIEAVCTD
ncbi:MAG: VOC family protein [Proteobacteria bacterium]|nr:VOC family protein [Pseudomonadota bacterium]